MVQISNEHSIVKIFSIIQPHVCNQSVSMQIPYKLTSKDSLQVSSVLCHNACTWSCQKPLWSLPAQINWPHKSIQQLLGARVPWNHIAHISHQQACHITVLSHECISVPHHWQLNCLFSSLCMLTSWNKAFRERQHPSAPRSVNE